MSGSSASSFSKPFTESPAAPPAPQPPNQATSCLSSHPRAARSSLLHPGPSPASAGRLGEVPCGNSREQETVWGWEGQTGGDGPLWYEHEGQKCVPHTSPQLPTPHWWFLSDPRLSHAELEPDKQKRSRTLGDWPSLPPDRPASPSSTHTNPMVWRTQAPEEPCTVRIYSSIWAAMCSQSAPMAT